MAFPLKGGKALFLLHQRKDLSCVGTLAEGEAQYSTRIMYQSSDWVVNGNLGWQRKILHRVHGERGVRRAETTSGYFRDTTVGQGPSEVGVGVPPRHDEMIRGGEVGALEQKRTHC